MKVLVVEDEPSVCQTLSEALTASGFDVTAALNGLEGLSLAQSNAYDLILLDVMLPGMDGVMICRELRKSGSKVPIIFLTARGELEHKVAGLDAGADDYLAKPFEIAELMARVRANVRRTSTPSTTLVVEPIVLDQIERSVRVGKHEVVLSRTEFALLELLMLSQGRTTTRVSIMQKVWKQSFSEDKVIDVYVSSLRKKLGPAGKMILTDRGVGYRIQEMKKRI